MDSNRMKQLLGILPKEDLVDMLTDIWERLNCDENGKYCPEESVAGGSSADFVEAVNWVFSGNKLGD